MKAHILFALAASTVAMSLPAMAQETAQAASAAPVDVRSGMTLISADGRRIGRIDSVVSVNDAPFAVKVIKDMKMLSVPYATLSASEKKSQVVTSLKYSELR